MIPYGHQSIDHKDIEKVVGVLKSDWLTQGPDVTEFEQALASYSGAKFAAAVGNGTEALHLAYLAAGIQRGDEVITTPNSFVATTNMLLTCGVKVVFADIRLDTYNINEKDIEKLITKKTKAIVPVHFAGHPCEMDDIYRIARKNNLLVIDDACHALGARYHEKKIGSLKSDMTVLSFHAVKAITTGEGGAVLTDNKGCYEKIKLFRSHGVTKDKNGFNVMTELGFNYRITDFQAALGLSQLKKIDQFLEKRHHIVSWYKKFLGNMTKIILPVELPDNYSGWHLYVVRVKNARERLKLMTYLKNKGVGVNFHYPAIYSHPYYFHNGYSGLSLKNADIYQSTAITLPCFPALTFDQVKYISQEIKNFFDHS